MYDVAIIGAGPAGSTLSRLIGKDLKVLLVDKRSPVRSSDTRLASKCCGGLLAPHAQAMLSRFGLWLPKNVLVDPQLFVVRTIDLQQNLEQFYQRYYINMDRNRFDYWLLSLVPENVDIRLIQQYLSYSFENDHFKITLKKNNKTYTEKAKILIGADGALSRVRKQTLPKGPQPKTYFAVQEWVKADHTLPYFTAIFDDEVTDYYGWTIPKGESLIIGAALPLRKDVMKKFNLFKSKLKSFGYQFGETVLKEGTFIMRPTKVRHLFCGSKRIAFIGEAGGWISPSSAEGISYALKCAYLLSEALLEGPDDFERRYSRKIRSLKRNIFFKNLKSHFIFNPILRKIAMRSGISSMKLHKSAGY